MRAVVHTYISICMDVPSDVYMVHVLLAIVGILWPRLDQVANDYVSVEAMLLDNCQFVCLCLCAGMSCIFMQPLRQPAWCAAFKVQWCSVRADCQCNKRVTCYGQNQIFAEVAGVQTMPRLEATTERTKKVQN